MGDLGRLGDYDNCVWDAGHARRTFNKSLNVGIQAISEPEDAAMAASMYGFFRSLGMPIGVAVS
jgi:hypothetical protein